MKTSDRENQAIAVVGADCLFPAKSNGLDNYWKSLKRKTDGIVDIPGDRWDHTHYYSTEMVRGKTFVKQAGFAENVFDFDPEYFGITRREAEELDPQQRLLILTAWRSIQDAGYHYTDINANTGFFAGISYCDYFDFSLAPQGVEGFDQINGLGNQNAIAVGRAAYVLGLNGPVVQLDTICSSSLMSIHLAAQSLKNRECDYALAGGVSLILSPNVLIALAQMGALSKDARCRPFSKFANGYIRGEGSGILLLKRLGDAVVDADHIHGVIMASATNHDGRSNGLTAPNGQAQEALLRLTIEQAGLRPKDIGYVETHGTGTFLGDPVELNALDRVFSDSKSRHAPLYIGSVKSNIGHLEPAAGIASIIKALLIIKHHQIPPTLHLDSLNPNFRWDEKPIVPVSELMDRPCHGDYIGVSAFSMTGANVHVILGPHKCSKPISPEASLETPWPVFLSAKNQQLLKLYAASLKRRLAADTPIRDLAFTLLTGREVFAHSAYCLVSTTGQLRGLLERFPCEDWHWSERSGIGTGMRIHLNGIAECSDEFIRFYLGLEVFRTALVECDPIFHKYLDSSLQAILKRQKAQRSDAQSKALNFAVAYAWLKCIDELTGGLAGLESCGDGDYLGAVLERMLALEKGFLLFVLEPGQARKTLCDGLAIGRSTGWWKDGTRGEDVAFWEQREEAGDNTPHWSVVVESGEQQIIDPRHTAGPEDLLNEILKLLLISHECNGNTDWKSFFSSQVAGNNQAESNKPQRLSLPAPPLDLKRYVSDTYATYSRRKPHSPFTGNGEYSNGEMISNILQRESLTEEPGIRRFVSQFSPANARFISDHKVQGQYLFPFEGYLSMLTESLSRSKRQRPERIVIREMRIEQPMLFTNLEEQRQVLLKLDYRNEWQGSWTIYSQGEEANWRIHAGGLFSLDGITTSLTGMKPDKVRAQPFCEKDLAEEYQRLAEWGIDYGPQYRLINRLFSDRHSVYAEVVGNQDAADYYLAPESLDACLHAIYGTQTLREQTDLFVPYSFAEIIVHKRLHKGQTQQTLGVYSEIIKEDAESIVLQSRITSETGEKLVELKGLAFKRLTTGIDNDPSAQSESAFTYEETWSAFTPEQPHESTPEALLFFGDMAQDPIAHQCKRDAISHLRLYRLLPWNEVRPDFQAVRNFIELDRALENAGIERLSLFSPLITSTEQLGTFFIQYQQLLRDLSSRVRIRLVTANAISMESCVESATGTDRRLDEYQLALWGLAKTSALEFGHRWQGVVDIDWREAESSAATFLSLLASEIPDQLHVAASRIHTPVLQRKKFRAKGGPVWNEPVLITGGLGMLGKSFVDQLIHKGCREIYLMSRNPAWVDTQNPQDLTAHQQAYRETILAYRQSGIHIQCLACDVADEKKMLEIRQQLEEKAVRTLNVIHCAGVASRHRIEDYRVEDLQREWRAKYIGAKVLERVFGGFDNSYSLYASSIASLWSGDGLAAYASGNLLLDGLAINRNAAGKRTLSIRYGRFDQRGLLQQSDEALLEQSGVKPLNLQRAIGSSFELIASDAMTPSMMEIEWDRFAPLYGERNRNHLLSAFTSSVTEDWPDTQQRLEFNTQNDLAGYISHIIAEQLGISSEDLAPDAPLFELGLNSMMSLSIKNDLQQALGMQLSATLLYNYNTVNQISKHLFNAHLTQSAGVANNHDQPRLDNKQTSGGESNEYDHYSEEELVALLAQELE
jgi:acyl transferase domain-containing protein/acyl carrier protein